MAYVQFKMPSESSNLSGAGPIFPDGTFENWPYWIPDPGVPLDFRKPTVETRSAPEAADSEATDSENEALIAPPSGPCQNQGVDCGG